VTDDLGLGLSHDTGHRAGPPSYGRRRFAMLLVALAVIAVIAGVAFAGVKILHRLTDKPADWSGAGNGSVVVEVHTGDTLTDVGTTLVSKGVVRTLGAFTDAASSNPTVNPGFYRLHLHMQASLALKLLLSPTSQLHNAVTIPEGRRLRDIVPAVAQAIGVPVAKVQAATKSPAALGVPSWGAGHPLEGFLFPATYDFPPNTTAVQALSMMVQRFNQQAQSIDLVGAAQKLGRTPYEVLTLASIIEREGRLTSDFPKIAEVFYNRLRSGMSLGSDATLYYVLPDNNGPLRQSQLHLDSPYNTRLHTGLPPTPIASPGANALQAALHPAHGSYLYFVTIDKAGHAGFATTDAEFQHLVAESRANGVQ
jgi:UPF0755 protein